MALRFFEICTDCRSDDASLVDDYRNGNRVCQKCGLVSPERIVDTQLETRSFDVESRVGAPVDEFLTTLSTTIGDDSNVARRLQQRGILTSKEQRMVKAHKEMKRISIRLSLNDPIVSRGLELLRTVLDTTSLRGKSFDSVIVACLYIACREAGVNRTLKEMEAHTYTTKKQLGRAYKFVIETAKLIIDQHTNPERLIDRFVNAARLDVKIAYTARQIARNATLEKISMGRQPESIVAGCIFYAGILNKQPIPATTIVAVTGVSGNNNDVGV
ncbi:hypothetical protein GEMRC1_006935 [Eukaryota sp. GEM-RC1]